MLLSILLPPLTLALSALAKTDLAGCTSTAVGPALLWYVPDTCEQCKILDCGGGRAPPKTNVPGCAAYVGTETYTPTFLTICGQQQQQPGPSSAPVPAVTPSPVAATSTADGYPAASTPVLAPSSSPSPAQSSPSPVLSSSLSVVTPAPSSILSSLSTVGVGFTSRVAIPSNSTATLRAPANGTVSTGGPKLPEHTGAAAVVAGMGQGVVAVVVGVLGAALL